MKTPSPQHWVATVIIMAGCLLPAAGRSQPNRQQLEGLAATMAHDLAAACPMVRPDDLTAFQTCVTAIKADHSIPFGDRLLWGGDQPDLAIRKKAVTNFHKDVFQLMYLPLFAFSGQWSVSHDDRDDLDIIWLGAMFRNQLPPGEYPYPFWHSAAKWADYEAAAGVNFYLSPEGKVILATRARDGSTAGRPAYAHREPPVFDGAWQWTDAHGGLEPRASLFSNKYSHDNPFLAELDSTYKKFALELRDGKCIRCHAPNNRSGMDRLVLLQTPVHAAAEIDGVLKEVRAGDMPQDDFGFKKPIDAALRDSILTSGEQFRAAIEQADQWESAQSHP